MPASTACRCSRHHRRSACARSAGEAVAELGATYVSVSSLRLRKTAQQRYFPFIEREFPHLTAHYRKAYATTWHLSDRYRASLGTVLRQAVPEVRGGGWNGAER